VDLHHLLLAGLPAHSCEKAAVGDPVNLVIGIRRFSTRTAAIGIREPL
jgi:hypothetical protein